MCRRLIRWAKAGAPAIAAALTVVKAAQAVAPPVDVVGHLSSSEFASYIAPQSYRDWGNEPCIAVNPTNPQEIVISSFGYGSWISNSTAQLWHSTNGGASWTIRFSVPTPVSSSGYFLDDQTYAYDSLGVLHGAIYVLDTAGNDYIYHGTTTDVNTSAAWSWNGTPISSIDVDQPWIAISGNSVAIAYDNFNPAYSFSEERVALSTDNGATFSPNLDLAVCSPAQVNTSIVNPGLRIAADNAGDFFILCGVRTNNNASGVPLINYRLNRYSGGIAWDFTTAAADAIGGVAVANGPSRQGNNSSYSFGNINILLGNITAIAVNADGSRVYVVYGISDANRIGHLFLQRFQASRSSLARSGGPLPLSSTNFSAALPSVAVANNGVVGVLFDEFDGTNFHVRLALSLDGGSSVATNMDLYSFATNGMVLGYGTTPSHNRLLGDYGCLTACGSAIYGAFAGRGNVSAGAINTTNLIVPFFFTLEVSAWRPFIMGITRPSANSVGLDFAGIPNTTYFVQATTNLSPPVVWQTVSTNVSDANGRWSYTGSTLNSSRRFYRASLLP